MKYVPELLKNGLLRNLLSRKNLHLAGYFLRFPNEWPCASDLMKVWIAVTLMFLQFLQLYLYGICIRYLKHRARKFLITKVVMDQAESRNKGAQN